MGNRSGYEDVDSLKDSEGVVAIISRRVKDSSYSFALMREFERDEKTERTSFLPPKAADAAKRLIDRTLSRITELEELDRRRAPRRVV